MLYGTDTVSLNLLLYIIFFEEIPAFTKIYFELLIFSNTRLVLFFQIISFEKYPKSNKKKRQ